MNEKHELMDENAVSRALMRIAHEILERNKGAQNVALVGILTRGVPMAKIVAENIAKIEGSTVEIGTLDITLYRDDLTELAEMPRVNATKVDFSVKDKNIVLCDDVLFTGRTARAAMEALLSLGRPRSIQFAALIDRGHRELPIRADYVGKNIPTSLSEMVSVRFRETDGEQNVKLFTF